MGWVRKLFGAVSKEEMKGIQLDMTHPHWEVDGPKTFRELFTALQDWLPEEAIMCFEGGSPDAEIDSFVAAHSIPEQSHVAMGTIWPRPRIFHVPATATTLTELTRIMDHHAEPELAVHFHVYRDNAIILEWYDAFDQPMRISDTISEEQVTALSERIGKGYRKISK